SPAPDPRPRQPLAPAPPRLECRHRGADREIGLAGTCRTERNRQVMALDRRHQPLLPVALRTDTAPIALLALRSCGPVIARRGPGVPYFGETDRQSGMRRALSHQPLHQDAPLG